MATVIASAPINMIDPVIWYGYVSSYDAAHITISDGALVGTYYGSFSYDVSGNVYGTLTGFKTWLNGELTFSITGASVNAYTYYSAIQSGDGELAVRMVLTGNDSVTGSGFGDALVGYAGKDTVDGGAGNDLILGGDGADRLNGSAGADTIAGEAGNDRISGGTGADLLSGGGGADTIAGGSGRDVLNGGADSSRDVFDFNLASDSGTGAQADRIERFSQGIDKIDVSGIDANSAIAGNSAFTFNGTSARAHSIWYAVQSDGIRVFGDVDGNRIADFEIFLADGDLVRAVDFIL